MKIVQIDILSDEVLKKADAVCFTSNGIRKKNGALVMGAGVAKAFRDEFEGIDYKAGEAVRDNGNICQIISYSLDCFGAVIDYYVVAFPTKNHWRNPSDLVLIEKSARELVKLADEYGWKNVYLPAPGCKNGQLNFTNQVKPLIEKILDDRFTITFLPRKR